MDVEAMRRAGYATVDALVARLANPRVDPVLRRATATPVTVKCVVAGRLLKLSREDFQWLADTEPTVQAELAKALAERLRHR